MKTKFIVLLFMMLLSFFAKAEKTYRHDHDVCKVKGEMIDLDLHAFEQYSDSEDDEYGELVFLKHNQSTIRIDLRQNGMGRFRMMKLYNDYCPKVLTIAMPKDEMAFFFLKDNRPFQDQVVIIYYNITTRAHEVITSEIAGKNYFLKDNRLYLKASKDDTDTRTGSVVIHKEKYSFIDRKLDPWVSFDGRHVKLETDLTWERFEYNGYIRKAELKSLPNLYRTRYKVAFNPFTKKKCLSVNDGDWKCL